MKAKACRDRKARKSKQKSQGRRRIGFIFLGNLFVSGKLVHVRKRLRCIPPGLHLIHGQMTAPRAVVKARKASSRQLLTGWRVGWPKRNHCRTHTDILKTFGSPPLQRPSAPPAPQCRSRTCEAFEVSAKRSRTPSGKLPKGFLLKHHGCWQRKAAPHQLPGRMELRRAQDALRMAILAASWEPRRHGAAYRFRPVGTAFVAHSKISSLCDEAPPAISRPHSHALSGFKRTMLTHLCSLLLFLSWSLYLSPRL